MTIEKGAEGKDHRPLDDERSLIRRTVKSRLKRALDRLGDLYARSEGNVYE